MDKNLTEKVLKLKFEVFDNFTIQVVYTTDIVNTVERISNSYGLNESVGPSCCGCHISIPTRNFSFIIVPYKGDVNSIVHESYHAVCNLFKYVGAKHEEELFAYHLDYIVGRILKYHYDFISPELEKLDKELDKLDNIK